MIPDRKLNQAIREAIQADMDELEISSREVDEAWILFKQRIKGETRPQPRPYLRIRPWAAVAAAVVLFLLGGALLPSGTALGRIVLGYFQSDSRHPGCQSPTRLSGGCPEFRFLQSLQDHLGRKMEGAGTRASWLPVLNTLLRQSQWSPK